MLALTELIGFGVVPGIGGNDAFTKLLLHGDGADASTTFTDSSASAHAVAPVGDAQIDTAQSKFGGASCLFDGTGDYLTLDGSADFTFGTGDFTIDCWLRLNALGSNQFVYDGRPSATEGVYPTLYVNSSNALIFHTNSATRITGGTLSINTWYHIALARSGSSTMMFLNGAQQGSTYSDSNNYLGSSSPRPFIANDSKNIVSPLNGWLDEFRISKGIARWTTTFTPPAEPYS